MKGWQTGWMTQNERYQELFEEIRRLHNRLRWVGDALHEQAGVTSAMRSLLFSLEREGPLTVPELARERLVSRQIIQTQINQLLEQDLVESRPNPRHRRSKHLALTRKGAGMVRNMQQREEELLKKAGSPLSPEQVDEASQSLRSLRLHLEQHEAEMDAL